MRATDYATNAVSVTDEAISLTIEALEYMRADGASLKDIVEPVKQEAEKQGWQVGEPESMSPDDVIYWLAMIWTGYLAREE